MVHFGFSYIGCIFLLLLFTPNIIWTRNKPADYEKHVVKENKALLFLERVGEVSTSILALIFSDFNFRPFTIWSLWLYASIFLMVLYELYWIRYFRSPKTLADMYSSFAGFPVAGASLPCIAFFCLGIYGTNIFMILSAIILSIGHIGIHLQHRNDVVARKETGLAAKAIRIVIAIPVSALLLLAIVGIAGRNINWFRGYIDTSTGINESSYVEISGQEQYISIRGRDINNPVILYIHGGPAGPDSAIMPVFTDPLIDEYTVVCWDQRGCGRTYFRNAKTDPENKTVSFEQALIDTDELVDYIRERFGQDKIIIMGHSFGTVVGTRYIQLHSEKVSAYVGIGQFVNVTRSDTIAYQDALDKAKANGEDTSALEKAYREYLGGNSLNEYLTLRQATSKYHPAPNKASTIGLAFFSPYTGVDDVRWVLIQADTDRYYELELNLMNTAYTFDIYDYPLEYDVPMCFISGDFDYICNSTLTEAFCNDITAPTRSFTAISGDGHSPQYDTPDSFGYIVTRFLSENT